MDPPRDGGTTKASNAPHKDLRGAADPTQQEKDIAMGRGEKNSKWWEVG